ncbi:hypothetical protein BDZ97DRAFT_1766441 [Flammula alnicola]|nr:hypothetical protein BDZ97DRAFT_1766441 [Flammula alnicola]
MTAAPVTRTTDGGDGRQTARMATDGLRTQPTEGVHGSRCINDNTAAAGALKTTPRGRGSNDNDATMPQVHRRLPHDAAGPTTTTPRRRGCSLLKDLGGRNEAVWGDDVYRIIVSSPNVVWFVRTPPTTHHPSPACLVRHSSARRPAPCLSAAATPTPIMTTSDLTTSCDGCHAHPRIPHDHQAQQREAGAARRDGRSEASDGKGAGRGGRTR